MTPSISEKLIEKLQEYEPGSDTYKNFERTAIDATGIIYAGGYILRRYSLCHYNNHLLVSSCN